MYTLEVRRDFVAQHYLIGGDFGPENDRHSHHYLLELHLRGEELDELGYLVDITEVERVLDATVARYRDNTLNDLEEFSGLNPSIEHFCRILWRRLRDQLPTERLSGMEVRMWENEIARAGYEENLGS
ncbi:MAG: 6-pyruvoyl trahydropterin synthase family protein [Alkalispirochaetaceae bacterium]